MRRPILLAASLMLVLGACAQAGSTPPESPDPSAAASEPATRQPFETTTPSAGKEAIVNAPESIPDPVWQAILADVSRRTGAEVTDPAVIEAHPQTWNDGSLGCPQPGHMYTQALVDGYQVVLEVDGERYDYRVGRGTEVKLCRDQPPRSG